MRYIPRSNEFDPRFSEAEKEAMRVVTYDDMIEDHMAVWLESIVDAEPLTGETA